MKILSVQQGNEVFNVGDVVRHINDSYTVTIEKFISGPAEDQMWFYFKDSNEENSFKESGEDNYLKDLKNFTKKPDTKFILKLSKIGSPFDLNEGNINEKL